MVVWAPADCCGNGDASGMPDSEMCVSGGIVSGRAGVLAGEKIKIENENRFVKQALLIEVLCK